MFLTAPFLSRSSSSLTTSHPFLSARESVLPLFERELQSRRTQPDASIPDLFVHLHGILFTRIQLDDFEDVFARFKERLEGMSSIKRDQHDNGQHPHSLGGGGGGGSGDELSQAAWMMMATINIAALLQYGAEDAVLSAHESNQHVVGGQAEERSRNTEKADSKVPKAIMLNQAASSSTAALSASARPSSTPEGTGVTSGSEEGSDAAEGGSRSSMEVGEEKIVSLEPVSGSGMETSEEDSVPLTVRNAVRLTFAMLECVLRLAVAQPGASPLPNPYITILLTFLMTMAKEKMALDVLERCVPWRALVDYSAHPRAKIDCRADTPNKIVGPAPLPEDWCLRGMSWVSRRVYERGFWKPRAGSGSKVLYESEVDVLTRKEDPVDTESAGENLSQTDEDEEGPSAQGSLADSRWKRSAYAMVTLAKTVPGLDCDVDTNKIVIVEPLSSKLERWRTEEVQAQMEQKLEQMRVLDQDDEISAELDDGESETSSEEDGDNQEDDADSPEIKELKARRRYLKGVMRAAKAAAQPLSPRTSPRSARPANSPRKLVRPAIKALPGFTILVLDTNVLLTSGGLLEQLVEACRWTVIVPLAVLTELDGLKHNPAPLGDAASRAIAYLETRIRSHRRWLKVQTSRGNYLYDLTSAGRTEDIDFAGIEKREGGDAEKSSNEALFARSMDDLVLRAVAWHDEHHAPAPRAAMAAKEDGGTTAKVLLVTFDRNLRLKARARGLGAADERDLADILLAKDTAPNG